MHTIVSPHKPATLRIGRTKTTLLEVLIYFLCVYRHVALTGFPELEELELLNTLGSRYNKLYAVKSHERV